MSASLVRRTFRVNGRQVTVAFEPLARLLDVLRGPLGLLDVKEGCGEGECGTCTVLLDGEPHLACLTAAAQLDDGAEITTVEGLVTDELGQALAHAFDHHGAVQCGYCTPGMMVGSLALLRRSPMPDEAAIRQALAGHLCRCTGYRKIVEAVSTAAAALARSAPKPEVGP